MPRAYALWRACACLLGLVVFGTATAAAESGSWFSEPVSIEITEEEPGLKGTPNDCQSCLPDPDENGGQTCSIDNCSPWVDLGPPYEQHDYHPILCDWFTLGTEHCITPMQKKQRECDARWDCGSGGCECAGRGLFIEAFPIDPPGRRCHYHCEGLGGVIIVGPGQVLHAQPFQWNCAHDNAPCDLKEARKNAVGEEFPMPTSGSCWSCWDRDTCKNGIQCPDASHQQGNGGGH